MSKTKIQELSTEKLIEMKQLMVDVGLDIENFTDGSIGKQYIDELKIRQNNEQPQRNN